MPMHTENRKVFKVQYKMGKRPSDQKKRTDCSLLGKEKGRISRAKERRTP